MYFSMVHICFFFNSRLLKQEPKFYYGEKKKKRMNKKSETCEKKTTGIFDLNFDCLVHIVSYLGLKDMANLDLVSDKFKPSTENSYKKYKSFDFKSIPPVKRRYWCDLVNFFAVRTILKQIGSHLTSITINRHVLNINTETNPQHFLELVLSFCLNLENICIEGITLNDEMLKKMKILFTKLKSIQLISCNIDDSIIGEYLETAKFLQKLDFDDILTSGKCISNIKNIISLNLSFCQMVQPNYFADFCKNNKNLVQLNIIRCEQLTSSSVVEITTNLLDLEELAISGSYNLLTSNDLLKFANLPKLKKLIIKCYKSTADVYDLLAKLAKIDKLQVLELTEIPCTNKFFKALFSFTKLEVLDLQNDWTGLGDFDYDDTWLSRLQMKKNIKELHFFAGCYDIKEASLISFVENSPNIRVLDVSIYSAITNKFYYRVSTFLKKQNRKHCLTVEVNSPVMSMSAKSIDPEIIEENLPWIQLKH